MEDLAARDPELVHAGREGVRLDVQQLGGPAWAAHLPVRGPKSTEDVLPLGLPQRPDRTLPLGGSFSADVDVAGFDRLPAVENEGHQEIHPHSAKG